MHTADLQIYPESVTLTADERAALVKDRFIFTLHNSEILHVFSKDALFLWSINPVMPEGADLLWNRSHFTHASDTKALRLVQAAPVHTGVCSAPL